MTYIKRLVMQGFKSFVKKTEIPFSPGINVVIGPNGSGKSNISDAICFALGRRSPKSMRAENLKKLIFLGTKELGPAKEAVVEIVFDNTDKTFSIEAEEISIKRIIRKNAPSMFKINDETKTMDEVATLLDQAEIDPNGFNIILQGEIQNFVRMHPEERRKIIEEVSGIAVYESRKEKSVKELEKTDEKLKQVETILRERTAYLNNLERERQEALKFKKYETEIKSLKASILYHDLSRKKKEIEEIIKESEKKNTEIEKVKKVIATLGATIAGYEQKIIDINEIVKKSSGLEQEKLNQEIANLRAELAGLFVKVENHEKKKKDLEKRKEDLEENLSKNESLLRELRIQSPTISQKQKELEHKKKELEALEAERKKYYVLKSDIKAIKDRLQDKQSFFQSYTSESHFLLKQIDSIAKDLFDHHTTSEKVDALRLMLAEKRELLANLNTRELELEKIININEHEIDTQNKVIEKIAKLDVCPLCKSKITDDHIGHIKSEAFPKISELEKGLHDSEKELTELYQKRDILKKEVEDITFEMNRRQSDLAKIININEKKDQIKMLQEKLSAVQEEIVTLDKKKKQLEASFDDTSNVEEKYELARVELQEISIRSEENVNSEISFKQKGIERMRIELNQCVRDLQDMGDDDTELKKQIAEREALLKMKREQEENLVKKNQKLLNERDEFQKLIRVKDSEVAEKKQEMHLIEQTINNRKIDKARIDAEVENLEIELLDFPGFEKIGGSKETLQERLAKTQEAINKIGSVNLRALEVYDSIKQEYEAIVLRVETINKEKEGIMKIVHEIDIKKKKAFLGTLESVNTVFSKNFAQISSKGEVFLDLENKKEPFDGGVGIVLKTGHGKYFDVTSLSGGEQTMVALSLIFAIQELKPYCFYLLDEIDAALDPRNADRLAGLLQKYMQKGQYIIISHKNEIITNATNLYGITMIEGVSHVRSLTL